MNWNSDRKTTWLRYPAGARTTQPMVRLWPGTCTIMDRFIYCQKGPYIRVLPCLTDRGCSLVVVDLLPTPLPRTGPSLLAFVTGLISFARHLPLWQYTLFVAPNSACKVMIFLSVRETTRASRTVFYWPLLQSKKEHVRHTFFFSANFLKPTTTSTSTRVPRCV